MVRKGIIIAGILGVVGVIGGAFGAHALKEILDSEKLVSFNTGIRYQLVHALAILITVLLYGKYNLKQFKIASKLFFIGVLMFSGSIYLLALKDVLGMPWLKFLGPITPVGGLLIISGWVFVILGGLKIKKD